MNGIMDKFNTWLMREMEKRGMNQTDLAKRGGFNPASLSRVLNGTRKIGLDMAVAIARALKMRPERIMYEAGLIASVPDEDAIIEEFDSILAGWTERDRQVWLELTRVRDSQIESERDARAAGRTRVDRTG